MTRSWRLVVVALLAGGCLLALASADAAFGPQGPQQRISFMGPNGDPEFDAFEPIIAYNSTADEYLVVWRGEDNTPPLVQNEFEIFAQRLSGAGTLLGQRIRVSTQGANGNQAFVAADPGVAYNPHSNEYLVVWRGSDSTANDFEIWGRRLSAAGDKLGGSDDLQLSEMGGPDSAVYAAFDPSVAANPTTGEYLVVWSGDTPGQGLADDEFEIFGQRVSAEGVALPPDDLRISEQGADGNEDSDAENPSVAYNSARDEYLVAWYGDIGTGTSGEFEIWAQRLSATGAEVGGSDFPVSGDGQPTSPKDNDRSPSVAANPSTDEYLVAWEGEDPQTNIEDGLEIFAQLLSGSGARVGGRVRVSDQGPEEDNENLDALDPSVAYDPSAREYLVAWRDEEFNQPPLGDKFEIFAQRLSSAGEQVGESDFRISRMGRDSSIFHGVHAGSVAANPATGEYLVVWAGAEDEPTGGELEIYGRRLGVPAPTLAATDPPGPANDNAPWVKGTVAADATVDVFTNGSCAGAPAVNDAPGSALNGAGIAVQVADNTITEFSATASSDGRTSRCSNSISYSELTPPAPPPPTPPPPPEVDVAPIVSGFAVSPPRFRAGGRSSFRFRLSERATTRILIERSLPGRRVGRRCVAPTRKHRKRARCKRFRPAGTLTFRNRPEGQNRIAFRGRVGKRALAIGSSRATITATDAAGNRSRPRRANFRIVRR